MSTDVTAEFDYSEVAESDRSSLMHYAKYVRRQEANTVEALVKIGDCLLDAKRRLKHGMFGRWMKAEFPHWSDETSRRYMRLAEAKKQNPQICGFSISVNHELLGASVGDGAVEEAIERHEAGEEITVATAKEIAKRHAKPKKARAEGIEAEEAGDGDESKENNDPQGDAMEVEGPPQVFNELRAVFDRMTPVQRITAAGMWRNWCDPE